MYWSRTVRTPRRLVLLRQTRAGRFLWEGSGSQIASGPESGFQTTRSNLRQNLLSSACAQSSHPARHRTQNIWRITTSLDKSETLRKSRALTAKYGKSKTVYWLIGDLFFVSNLHNEDKEQIEPENRGFSNWQCRTGDQKRAVFLLARHPSNPMFGCRGKMCKTDISGADP